MVSVNGKKLYFVVKRAKTQGISAKSTSNIKKKGEMK